MLCQKLKKLSLSASEAKIYAALLELGTGTVSEIAKKSKLKRTSLYEILSHLKNNGFIEESRTNKKRVFSITDPRVFGSKISEQEQVYQNILPEMLALAGKFPKKPKISFFEGVEGIKRVYEDTLNFPNQEILMWGAPEVMELFDTKFLENYLSKRIKKKISMRAIGPNIPMVLDIKSRDSQELRKTKIMPADSNPFEVEINLYGQHRVGIMSFKEEFGLIMESEKIYRTLKVIFELNFKLLS